MFRLFTSLMLLTGSSRRRGVCFARRSRVLRLRKGMSQGSLLCPAFPLLLIGGGAVGMMLAEA